MRPERALGMYPEYIATWNQRARATAGTQTLGDGAAQAGPGVALAHGLQLLATNSPSATNRRDRRFGSSTTPFRTVSSTSANLRTGRSHSA